MSCDQLICSASDGTLSCVLRAPTGRRTPAYQNRDGTDIITTRKCDRREYRTSSPLEWSKCEENGKRMNSLTYCYDFLSRDMSRTPIYHSLHCTRWSSSIMLCAHILSLSSQVFTALQFVPIDVVHKSDLRVRQHFSHYLHTFVVLLVKNQHGK